MLWFRQLQGKKREMGRKSFWYVVWNDKETLREEGIDVTGRGAWDYCRDDNKNTFKLVLLR